MLDFKTLFIKFFAFPLVLVNNLITPTPARIASPSYVSPQFTTHNSQFTISNTWFASANNLPSEYLHALPGIYKITPEGLRISQTSAVASKNAIVTPLGNDCVLKFPITNSQVTSRTATSVTTELSSQFNSSTLTLIQGSPIAYLSNPPMGLTCGTDPRFALKYPNPQTLLIMQLPINRPDLLPLFENYQFSGIPTPTYNYSQVGQNFITTLNTKNQSLITLMPHQYANLTSPLPVLAIYPSPLGDLRLVSTYQFSYSTPVPELKLNFPPLNTHNPAPRSLGEVGSLLTDALSSELKSATTSALPTGIYFKGTEVGKLASLISLGATYNLDVATLSAGLATVINDQLEAIKYDEVKQSYFASNPEFGHEFGNDHHFHYGYYLRAAAILENLNPSLLNHESKTKLTQLANYLVGESYPRFLDLYAAHTWADGRALFADGNNQESTSEALNAWAGAYLWALSTKYSELMTNAAWLYSQELLGTQTYWFGQSNPFPDGYSHPMASIVWGAKRDFATWFSGETLHIYGIQFLPLTENSTYLKTLPFPDKYLAEMEAIPDYLNHEWADLYLAYLSYTNPQKAVALLPQVKSSAGVKSRALLLQIIYQNLEKLF